MKHVTIPRIPCHLSLQHFSPSLALLYFLLIFVGVFPFAAFAEIDVRYELNQSLNDLGDPPKHPGVLYLWDKSTVYDTSDTYEMLTGEPGFGSDGETEYLNLETWDQYVGFKPSFLPQADLSQPTRFSIRFAFQANSPVINASLCCEGEIRRYVMGTNEEDQRSLGFKLSIQDLSGGSDTPDWRLILNIGDGRALIAPVESEGYRFYLGSISPNEWMQLDLIFYLNDTGEEKLVALFNGRPQTFFLNDASRLNTLALKRHLQGVPVGRAPDDTYTDFCSQNDCYTEEPDTGVDIPSLFVGGHPVNGASNGAEIALWVDSLSVQSPVLPATSSFLAATLEDFTAHINESLIQAPETLEAKLTDFIIGFNGDWAALSEPISAYLDVFSNAYDPLFAQASLRSPQTFDPSQTLAYFLQQWMLDSRFQGILDSTDSGFVFEDSKIWPGPVSADAPRVSGSVQVVANYMTDPAVRMNGQETVIRPTGYYAPPGELITLTVPFEAVTDNLKIRIGINRADMEAGLWSEFNRFPRISSLYDITQATITIASPFGGGIYFEVADETELGIIDVQISGAIKMPMFSTLNLAGHNNNFEAFEAEVDAWNVPWFELHGQHFSATLPMNEAKLYPNPAALLQLMDRGFEDIRLMAGRPIEGIRAEWLAYDRFVTYRGTALTASYPIYPDQDIDWQAEDGVFLNMPMNYASPARLLDSEFFDKTADNAKSEGNDWSIYILFHEWGHVHNLPTLRYQEQESNVHLLASVFFNRTMGADIDTALQFSGFQFFDRDQAALDTMFSPNWQIGNRLSEGEQIYGIWDNEVRYQTRSWARLVDIAALYGWEAVGKIHKAFYDRGVALGSAVNYELQDDDFIETASAALSLNLAPVFDFWGVPASPEAKTRLLQYPLPREFKARLLHYHSIAPRTFEEFLEIYEVHQKTNHDEVMIRMDYYKEVFDEATSATILSRISGILAEYPVESDNDLIVDSEDNCPTIDNPDQLNSDSDELGNVCDEDDDNDGLADTVDAFPLDSSEQLDTDEDGVGDNSDVFPTDATESADTDADSIGDNADLDDDNDGYSDEQEAIDGTDPLNPFSCSQGCFSFDIDLDEESETDALTDGLLVIRHLFGFSGDALVANATSNVATRQGAAEITSYLNDAESELDIDGDSEVGALTDGLLLIRYLFGFSGDALISGAVSENAERTTAQEIEAYISERIPN